MKLEARDRFSTLIINIIHEESRHECNNEQNKFNIISRLYQWVMIRAFEKTGISLKVDGSEDAEKMKFQGQEIGIPTGLDI